MPRKPKTAEDIAKWRASMQPLWDAKSIDRSKCGLPRNTPMDVWKSIERRGDNDCWPWVGRSHQNGYGVIRIQGVYYKAHRVAYSTAVAPIELRGPKDRYAKTHVLHNCDNPACCNPKHLRLGDIIDNMQDKTDRKRAWRGGPRKKCLTGQT